MVACKKVRKRGYFSLSLSLSLSLVIRHFFRHLVLGQRCSAISFLSFLSIRTRSLLQTKVMIKRVIEFGEEEIGREAVGREGSRLRYSSVLFCVEYVHPRR